MTEAELRSVDLPGRMAFADRVAESVVPEAQEHDTYAGAYIDQAAGGSLVLLFTRRDDAREASLRSLLPDATRSIEFREVRSSYADLEEAMALAWTAEAQAVLERRILSVSLDEAGNRLVIRVAESTPGDDAIVQVEGMLGVRVSAELGPVEQTAVCGTRDNCHTPLRAGIRIKNGANKVCSMGFAISRGSDLQFVTTGHCSHNGNANWSHNGSGAIGAVLETEYQDDRWDIMRVAMPDNQATNRIYAEIRRVHGRRDPLQGEAVCASLGVTDVLNCGTIADANVAYVDSNGLRIVNAADLAGININGGDSGSPVYVRSDADSAIAVALAATSTSDFASKLNAPFAHWGAGVIVGGP